MRSLLPRRGRRTGRPLVLFLLLVTLGLVLPTATASTSAAAAALIDPGQVTANYQNFKGPPIPGWSGPVSGTTACPAGQRMTGIGAGGYVRSLTPTATFSGARMTGQVASPLDLVQVVTLCAPSGQFGDVKTLDVRDHRTEDKSSQYIQTTGRCPDGYFAFGGGAAFEDSSGTVRPADWVVGNGPSVDGSSWQFTAMVPEFGLTLRLRTQCAPRTGKELLVQEFTDEVTGAWKNVSSYAHCPAGYTPIAGGFSVADKYGQQSLPTPGFLIAGNLRWSTGGPLTVDNGLRSWYSSVQIAPEHRLMVRAQCLSA
ncbi:hypothetical protein KIH74_06545 [Kineosporia sp. J2-2]|uniref:Uncharacterized protein n=1 Tax=Kineosporia corallincola TaxID=2835133 RepID=A0ABS5TBW4_9ACTN|nr:hypothetical protein [Kineosporia corallincola]MBT0768577.1 hypothetical protein [Kineosporia corallincola]